MEVREALVVGLAKEALVVGQEMEAQVVGPAQAGWDPVKAVPRDRVRPVPRAQMRLARAGAGVMEASLGSEVAAGSAARLLAKPEATGSAADH